VTRRAGAADTGSTVDDLDGIVAAQSVQGQGKRPSKSWMWA